MIQEMQGFAMGRTMTNRQAWAGVLCLLALVIGGCATTTGDERHEVLRLNQAALEAEKAGDDAAMLAAYRQLLDLDPERPRAWLQVGTIEAEKGNLDAAEAAFKNALEHDPDYRDARYNLGLVHMRSGAQLLNEARDGRPEDVSSRANDVYLSCLLAGVVRNPDIEIPCPDLP